MFGISAALTTPFTAKGAVDHDRLIPHIKTVLSEGCSSVTLFGTTGEGASVAQTARLDTLHAVLAAPNNPAQVILTLHGAAAMDVVDQVQAAMKMGVKRFLLPPPCYFDQPSKPGLFNWFAQVFDPFKDSGARFILYHIPQVIGVGLPIDLVADLKTAYPDLVLGVKDSSGSFDNTRDLLQLDGLQILVGDERQLAACAKIGAAGAISGIANLFPARLATVLASATNDAAINHLVDVVLTVPVTPAIKVLVAHKYGISDWRRTIAPLDLTPDAVIATLSQAYDKVATSA